MSFVRKRYYLWLLKAYFKKWKKIIFASILIGAVVFFLFAYFFNFFITPLFEKTVRRVGYFGIHTPQTLPENVTGDLSFGLTSVLPNGKIVPGAAESWEIKNDGKLYVFHLKKGLFFHNGEKLTAKNISLDFKNVVKKVINDNTISYEMKNSYSPFLSSVSKPLFIKNFQGLGTYKVKRIDINGGFVKLIILQNINNSGSRKTIYFYPSQNALKTAFALGEIDTAIGVTNLSIKGSDMGSWKNTRVTKNINYDELVSLFYNNADSLLSNKKLRQALNYALPPKFSEGLRAYSSIPPDSIFFSKPPNYGISDIEIATTLLSGMKDLDKKFEISTTEEYKSLADNIAINWKALGIKTEVKIVTEIPKKFQILLYPFKISQDPDQYTLWHSDQISNIIKYKNLRIDKLLEDGRSTNDQGKRLIIYADFQKYLTDDVPASFL